MKKREEMKMNPQEMKKLVSELHSTGLREVRYHPMDVQKRESAEDDGYVQIGRAHV